MIYNTQVKVIAYKENDAKEHTYKIRGKIDIHKHCVKSIKKQPFGKWVRRFRERTSTSLKHSKSTVYVTS